MQTWGLYSRIQIFVSKIPFSLTKTNFAYQKVLTHNDMQSVWIGISNIKSEYDLVDEIDVTNYVSFVTNVLYAILHKIPPIWMCLFVGSQISNLVKFGTISIVRIIFRNK